MAYCIFSPASSGTRAPFVGMAGSPAAGQPAMYLTFAVIGGGAAPVVTLAYGSGVDASTVRLTSGQASVPFFSFSTGNVTVTYAGPVTPPAPPPSPLGPLYQLQFFVDNAATGEMLNGALLSIQLDQIAGVTGQSYAWVVADNATDAFHDLAAPLSVVRSAVAGNLNVTGQSTLAGVTASGSAYVTGNLGVGTQTPGDVLEVRGGARILTDHNPLRFTSTWSGFPDATTNQAEISNDTGTYKTLMIVGNKSAGLGRRVSVWDRLEVNGTTDIEGPGQSTPFNVLTVNTATFGTPANVTQSYFITASDLGAKRVKFSVRGDGATLIDGSATINGGATISGDTSVKGNTRLGGVVDIEGPSQSTKFNVLTVNAASFDTQSNLTQSYFITASDLGAKRVKFSVRGDGALLVDGDATINGTLTATHKSFVIDHPLDPAQQQLVHGSLEGPESGVYYRGEGQLVGDRAVIRLPAYFEALTRREGRTVQLTPRFEGDEAVSLLAASVIVDGKFVVRTADGRNPGQRFFWEVKAVRADVPLLETERAKPAG